MRRPAMAIGVVFSLLAGIYALWRLVQEMRALHWHRVEALLASVWRHGVTQAVIAGIVLLGVLLAGVLVWRSKWLQSRSPAVRSLLGTLAVLPAVAILVTGCWRWIGFLRSCSMPDCLLIAVAAGGAFVVWWIAVAYFGARQCGVMACRWGLPVLLLTWGSIVFAAGQLETAIAVLATLAVSWVVGIEALGQFRVNSHFDGLERNLLGLAAGLGLLSLAVLGLGVLGLLYRFVVILFYGAVLSWAALRWRKTLAAWWSRSRMPASNSAWTDHPELLSLVIVASVILTVSLVASLGPEWTSDAIGGRTAAPLIYLREHTVAVQPNNFYSYFPSGCEMVFAAVASVYGGDTGMRLMHFACGVLAILAQFTLGRRLFDWRAGVIAAFVLASSSVVWFLLCAGYTDLMVLFLALAASLAFLRWLELGDRSTLVLCGLLIGLMGGTKLTAGINGIACGIVAIVALLLRRPRQWRASLASLVLFGVVALAAIAPWLTRSYLVAGNPVFPWLGNILPSALWPNAPAHIGIRFTPGNRVLDYARIPLLAVFDTGGKLIESGQISPLLLLLLPPWLGLFGQRRSTVLFGLYVMLMCLIQAPLDANLRYLLPQVALVAAVGAALCVAAGDGVPGWLRLGHRAVLVLAAAIGVPYALATAFWYGGASGNGFPYRVVFGDQSRDDYSELYIPSLAAINYVNRTYGAQAQMWAPKTRDFLHPQFRLFWSDMWLGRQLELGKLHSPKMANEERAAALRGMGFTHLMVELYDANTRKEFADSGVFSSEFLGDPRHALLEYAYKGYYVYKLLSPSDKSCTLVAGPNQLPEAVVWLRVGNPKNAMLLDESRKEHQGWCVDGENFLVVETSVQEGQLYRLSFLAKSSADGTIGRREVSWRNGGGRVLNHCWATPYSSSPTTRRVELLETAPTGAKTAAVYLRSNAPADRITLADVQFQHVRLESIEKSATSNLQLPAASQ